MITRFKVKGFKNLVDVDIQFGPFTCIAGVNGVGKSNLFDAIQFLSTLASGELLFEAAKSVRDKKDKTGSIKSIFHKIGDTYIDNIEFEVEMIVPQQEEDDLGQIAEATITFLTYKLKIKRKTDESSFAPMETLEIIEEELNRIKIGDATKKLLFPNKPDWRKSVIHGRRGPKFISTTKTNQNGNDIVLLKLHQDGSKGKPLEMKANALKKTLLSTVNTADERPTAFIARKEMQSWRLLQLEPSALRKPDEPNAPNKLGIDGSHLPSTLNHLSQQLRNSEYHEDIMSRIANRLSTLIDDIYSIVVDYDEKRQLFALQVRNKNNTLFDARSLSDGTLRFLALAVLEENPEEKGLICLEEPENGIHPGRIPAMIDLLTSIACDTNYAIDSTSPLRQVIINTHSPAIVQQVPEDSLLLAVLEETYYGNERTMGVSFKCLSNTWRDTSDKNRRISLGKLLTYLNPTIPETREPDNTVEKIRKRVIDRSDIYQLELDLRPRNDE
jgi:predicted ATPase